MSKNHLWCWPKPQIIAVMVIFIILYNVVYIVKIVTNKLVTWEYTNDFWEEHSSVWKVVVGIRRSHSSSVFGTVPIGCGWRVVGRETVSLERVCGVLVHLFLEIKNYSSRLHLSHPCAMRTISCLASVKVDSIIWFTTAFLATTSCWR